VEKKLVALTLVLALTAALLTGCASTENTENAGLAPLPLPEADIDSMFGIDVNINIDTIDGYLGRDDVMYIDLRMLFDPADFASIGGDPDLTSTIEGFRIVPYPFIATLEVLPVSGAYEGPCLYTLTWTPRGAIASVTPNYAESEMILSDLFPKDKAIFLMCGGGGYSSMMKSLLVYLGWDKDLLYVIGKHWEYTGDNSLELIIHPDNPGGDITYAVWRADYAFIDFSLLHEIAAK